MKKMNFFKLFMVTLMAMVLISNTAFAASGTLVSGNDKIDGYVEYKSGPSSDDKIYVKLDQMPALGNQALSLPGESGAITITGYDADRADGQDTIDWSYTGSAYQVDYVAVKASNSYMLYTYSGATSDTGLTSVVRREDQNGRPQYHDISHVTFYLSLKTPPAKTFNATSADSAAGHVEATSETLNSGESATFTAYVDDAVYYAFTGWTVQGNSAVISTDSVLTAAYADYSDGTTFVANYERIAEDITLRARIYDRADLGTKVTTGTLGYVKFTVGDGSVAFENNAGEDAYVFSMYGVNNDWITVSAVPHGTEVEIEGIAIDSDYEEDGYKNNVNNPRSVTISVSKTSVTPNAVFKAIETDGDGDGDQSGDGGDDGSGDQGGDGGDDGSGDQSGDGGDDGSGDQGGNGDDDEEETEIPEDETETPASVPTENPTQYTLTVIVVGEGSVPGFQGTHTFDSGTNVNLTAKPDNKPNIVFEGWSGDASGDDKHAKVVMTGDKTVVATFVEEVEVADNEVPESAPEEDIFDDAIAQGTLEDEDILDEDITESVPVDVIEDEELPQTGGIPMEVLSIAGLALSGLGVKLRKRK